MIVAYDAQSLTPTHRSWGVGVVISNIVSRLKKELDFVGLAPRFSTDVPEYIRYWSNPLRKLNILAFELSPWFLERYDLYWGTNHLLPQLCRGRTLLTVHDLLLYKYPEDQPWTRYVRARFASSVRRAHKLIADSMTTANDLGELFPEAMRKTEVVYLGFDVPQSSSIPQPPPDADPYVIVLGAHRPRKNIELALHAVAGVRDRGRRLRLTVTGNVHPMFAKALRAHAAFVDIVGVVPRDQLFSLLAGAEALLFPSLYEGFGLPILDAMSVGCPVIALDTPINREIAGNAAALLPNSVDAWMSEIQRLIDDSSSRAQSQKKGFDNLQRFDWDKSAREYLQLMRECLS